jgi:hypothetical protein
MRWNAKTNKLVKDLARHAVETHEALARAALAGGRGNRYGYEHVREVNPSCVALDVDCAVPASSAAEATDAAASRYAAACSRLGLCFTHRMENASFQSLRRSLAAHQPAYWLEKRSNEHVDFCLMRRGGDDDDGSAPHVVCHIQAKNLGAKVCYDDDDDADATWSASLRAPRRLYYHPDAVDALVLHVPRAPNMTARRKCDPDAWTGVLVQPLRASAWDSVGAALAIDPVNLPHGLDAGRRVPPGHARRMRRVCGALRRRGCDAAAGARRGGTPAQPMAGGERARASRG